MIKSIAVILLISILFGCATSGKTIQADEKKEQVPSIPPVPPADITGDTTPKIVKNESSANEEIQGEVGGRKPEAKKIPLAENKSTDIPKKESTPVKSAPPPLPKIINGKTPEQRLQEARDRLHTVGSAEQIRNDFPDIALTYTDTAENTGFPAIILPFKYYYSAEINKTFNICNIDFTVFICNGKLERLITKEDMASGRCEVTPIYMTDPRIGGSGTSGYGSYGYN